MSLSYKGGGTWLFKWMRKRRKVHILWRAELSSPGDNNLLGLMYEFPGSNLKPGKHDSKTPLSTFYVPKPGEVSQKAFKTFQRNKWKILNYHKLLSNEAG